MSSNGFWKEPTKYTSTLDQIKLFCTIAPAPTFFDLNLLDGDFTKSVLNLKAIQLSMVLHQDFEHLKGLLIGSNHNSYRVWIRHKLFKLIGAKNDDLGPEFKIENWLCTNSGAQEAICDMFQTHCVIPIPAYDKNDKLISSSKYCTILPSATIEAHFLLIHYIIKNKVTDGYNAFVLTLYAMHIIKPASLVVPSTPRKRKVSSMSPITLPVKKRCLQSSSPSPSKK
ncbi:hypothetical protein OBBRIDRAFT_805330 [Obba rivulosa]|uniref:Uncharacterized protein n=1 Tax=Obba rivulosa TaxID=1052685 RepID=A0A8E2AUR3_9APHY|nr:hypothetical protein OBBRIDRAFT_805330 [Obba rivulosa]